MNLCRRLPACKAFATDCMHTRPAWRLLYTQGYYYGVQMLSRRQPTRCAPLSGPSAIWRFGFHRQWSTYKRCAFVHCQHSVLTKSSSAQCRAVQSRAEQRRAVQSSAEQCRATQDDSNKSPEAVEFCHCDPEAVGSVPATHAHRR